MDAEQTSAEARAEKGKNLQLKVAAHVVVQLGAELVSDEEQAILELVKNAYDADSPDCVINIEPDWQLPDGDIRHTLQEIPPPSVPAPEVGGESEVDVAGRSFPAKAEQKVEPRFFPPFIGRIQVVDTGDGAAPADVHSGWLTVSFSKKRPADGGPKLAADGKRVPVGDKGLGRLATMRLGRVLTFTTAAVESPTQTVTSFNWDDFEKVATVDEVRVKEHQESRDEEKRGSTVEIVGLRDPARWKTVEGFNKLVARLSTLVNPFVPIPNFSVTVKAGSKSSNLAQVGEDALRFASTRYEFAFDGKTLTQRAYVNQGLFRGMTGEKSLAQFNRVFAQTEIIDEFIHWVKLNRRWKKRLSIDRASSDPSLALFECSEILELSPYKPSKQFQRAKSPGPFSAQFYYFLFNSDEQGRLKTIGSSKEQIQNMSGTSVFRDGFRIRMPDDWLGLSEGITSGNFYFLRPKNTLGYFSLTNVDNSQLIEKSDREGFVDNAYYQGFLDLALRCRDYANSINKAARYAFNEFLMAKDHGSEEQTTYSAAARIRESSKGLNVALQEAQRSARRSVDGLSTAIATLSSAEIKTAKDQQRVSAQIEEAQRTIQIFEKSLTTIERTAAEIGKSSDLFSTLQEDLESKNLRLLDAAAVGLAARVLVHELNSYLDQILEATRKLRNKARQDDALRDAVVDINSAAQELRKLVGGLDPLMPSTRSLKEPITVREAIADFLDARASTTQVAGLAAEVLGDSDLVIRFNRTRFYQILENLYRNSLYWAKSDRGDGFIKVECRADGFDWWDSGPGIKESLEGTLFDAFETAKPAGDGQGLGLHIVKTFLAAERCTIELLPERNMDGRLYKFRIRLERARTS